MSKNKLKSAKYSINELLKKIDGYSYASLADTRIMLYRAIKDLHHLGFKLSHVKGLKPKHIHKLVEHWKSEGKSTGTIKNHMSKLRKIAVLLDKPKLMKPRNDAYDIAKRSYIPTHNKAIHRTDFSACQDKHIRLSLEAQALFGLRREESMKLVLSEAYCGNVLKISPSWSKGGVGRSIPITNQKQVNWLRKASQQIHAGHSLISEGRTYKQHLSHYQTQLKKLGLRRCHGLRHAYAQQRYIELTRQFDPKDKGLQPPIDGGVSTKSLRGREMIIDRRARAIISLELGHSRISIVKLYCG